MTEFSLSLLMTDGLSVSLNLEFLMIKASKWRYMSIIQGLRLFTNGKWMTVNPIIKNCALFQRKNALDFEGPFLFQKVKRTKLPESSPARISKIMMAVSLSWNEIFRIQTEDSVWNFPKLRAEKFLTSLWIRIVHVAMFSQCNTNKY